MDMQQVLTRLPWANCSSAQRQEHEGQLFTQRTSSTPEVPLGI